MQGNPTVDRFRPIKLLAMIVFVPDVAWASFWFVMDILARLGLWPHSWDFVEIYPFITTHPLWAESVFFAAYAAKVLALVQMVRCRLSALPLLALAFVLHITDWLLLSGNAYYSASIDGALMVLAEASALTCLWYLHAHGVLRGGWFSLK